jgi:hypothetical protein
MMNSSCRSNSRGSKRLFKSGAGKLHRSFAAKIQGDA